MNQTSNRHWLIEILPRHTRLTVAVKSLLENILRERQIEYLDINGRVKTLDSALEKIKRKKYSNPKSQMTDLSGIRVITYLESQVLEVTSAIRELFSVDEENSLDRSTVLGSDRIGYRSAHFVCSLGEARSQLPEYVSLGDLKFEIQVRTVLQHAWAELAHDRSFKFQTGLPTGIQRKLNLYAGMLEIVDSAFDSIAQEIDEYTVQLNNKSLNQLSEVEINSISISKFIKELLQHTYINIEYKDLDDDILKELADFGVKNIGQLEAMATDDFIRWYESNKASTTTFSLLRDMMIYTNFDLYFSNDVNWGAIDLQDYEIFASSFGKDKVKAALNENEIDVLDGNNNIIDINAL
ncbi:GTP pyrophosphokinase [Microvirga puerhi]|uniref:RelA/SpoT domain-containing protein n=1 Tax=Microvirga puerhi TaxID=2876078 RepID=A0ABS7VHD0_9HYPH|nr:RelA/SpoT domain-containing protein [Microvirga puerhi]MBZ6074908.1 RelA/SpoT domain-containing protein [Microvirga puerhi]